MLNKFKKKFRDKSKYRLFENFFSLLVLQGTNYILPLITLPYLVRVLGPEKYGLIAFAQAFIQYFNMLTDYGFNLSATKEISIHRENKEKVSEIFSSVMTIKLALLIFSFIIMTIIVFSFDKFSKEWLIYYLAFGMVMGQVLFPVWFFQGMEKMKYITLLNIVAKLIFTISIFVFVHNVTDYIYVPFINSLGFIIAGIMALCIIFKNFEMEFKFPSLEQIKYQLKEGWYIFISTVAISLYTISNTFILGLFTNNTIVGYYSAAEKIIKAMQGLRAPISQTIYPYINNLAHKSKEQAISFIRKVMFVIGGGHLVLVLITFVFADLIVKVLLGDQYQLSTVVLRILAPLPFIIFLTNMFGAQLLLPFNIKRLFTLSIVIPSILHIILLFPFAYFYKEIGVALLVVFTEMSVLLFRIIGIFLFHKNIYMGIFYGRK